VREVLRRQGALLLRVARCLRRGGRCRFADDAVSPAFEIVKKVLLRPLRALLYPANDPLTTACVSAGEAARQGRSRAFHGDVAFTRIVWRRESFFLRIAQLLHGRAVKWDPDRIRSARPFLAMMRRLDDRVASWPWFQRNALALTWGFDK